MAGGKLTPRQKMINMMYLVLMALLALNVSKEILNAFIMLYESISTTNVSLQERNDKLYAQFERELANDSQRVQPIYNKATQIKELAERLRAYVDTIMIRVVAETDKVPETTAVRKLEDLKTLESKDNYDSPTRILIGTNPAAPRTDPYSAVDLKNRIHEFVDKVAEIYDPQKKEETKKLLENMIKTDSMKEADGRVVPWEVGAFYHVPAAAVLTTLNKIKSDIYNVEAFLVNKLLGEITADILRFDKVDIKTIYDPGPHVFIGDSFKLQVFAAAWSSTQNPLVVWAKEIKVDENGNAVPVDTSYKPPGEWKIENGMLTYVHIPKTEGEVKFGGVLKVKKPDGTFMEMPFNVKYMAFKPLAVISAPATAVFYRGLDNPLEVSVPGVPPEKLEISLTNGTFTGSKGKYMVRPGSDKECVVTVSVRGEDKKAKKIGEAKFKVKDVPPPTPFFGTKEISGSCKAPIAKLLAAKGVGVDLEDFVFEGVKFEVVSWKLSTVYKGNVVEEQATGPYKTPKMDDIIKALPRKTKISIVDIKVRWPDGKEKIVSPIVIEVL